MTKETNIEETKKDKPRWSWKKRTIICIGVFLLYGFLYGYIHSPIYKIEPIEATIVDSVTGEPVEGVVVVSLWRSYNTWYGRAYRVLRADEAVTAKDGKFMIEGSWPSVLLPFTILNRRSHDLYIYKHGYGPMILNTADKDKLSKRFGNTDKIPQVELRMMTDFYPIMDNSLEQRGYSRYSIWSGRNIELEKYDFDNFTDDDYRGLAQTVQSGIQTCLNYAAKVPGIERPPGSDKKLKLQNMARQIVKTFDFLNINYTNKPYEYRARNNLKSILRGETN